MTEGEQLFLCEDAAVWREVHEKYWAVVDAKDAGEGKNSGKLKQLEKWYQEALPEAILSRTECFLTHLELVKVMEWKLTRGTFRPRLGQLVASNSEEAVLQCSKRAFALLPDVRSAITELSSLKGVGPATASAVLTAGSPEEVAFMADEAVESIAELRPVKYTAKHFSLFLKHILNKTQQLNEVDSKPDWTPHKVELCLWAFAVARRIQPSLVKTLSTAAHKETKQTKIKEDVSEQPPKRRKKN